MWQLWRRTDLPSNLCVCVCVRMHIWYTQATRLRVWFEMESEKTWVHSIFWQNICLCGTLLFVPAVYPSPPFLLCPCHQWSLAESEMLPAFIQTSGGENASNLAYHERAHTRMLPLTPLNTAFCFFIVCKPGFISLPCIMVQRWYHQRRASLTKWEQQIGCSIRREEPLSGNLIGSH